LNENKIFTVIILSYNNLQYIEECLQSVLNQDYGYIEIIVSDDCSDNFDMIKIEKHIKDNRKDNIVNFIINRNEKNLGIVRNLNKVGRNDMCPCGSGKKYKKCCGKNK